MADRPQIQATSWVGESLETDSPQKIFHLIQGNNGQNLIILWFIHKPVDNGAIKWNFSPNIILGIYHDSWFMKGFTLMAILYAEAKFTITYPAIRYYAPPLFTQYFHICINLWAAGMFGYATHMLWAVGGSWGKSMINHVPWDKRVNLFSPSAAEAQPSIVTASKQTWVWLWNLIDNC